MTMVAQIVVSPPASAIGATPVRQATSDEHLIELWLHNRSEHTRRAYRADVDRFRAFIGRPLPAVTLGDLQDFSDSLASLKPASRVRTLAAVKSLLAFGHRLGYLPFDVGRALKLPGRREGLAARILEETDVHRMLALEPGRRNRVLLRLLYASGVRVAEVCALRWMDVQDRKEGAGQISVFGKGEKERQILLPASVYQELLTLRGGASADAPVFRSRKGGHALDTSQVLRIVRAATKRAGLEDKVSPHWLRHSHATHALERGAPIHLVAATLGHASVATTGKYLHARPTDSSARYLVV
jgi:integrase/recombinase XerD